MASPGGSIVRAWVERAAGARPDASYLEDARSRRRVTYGDLGAACRRVEDHLDVLELPKGVSVALCCADPLEYATTFIALLAAERVAVPLDPWAPAREVAQIQAAARPLAVVRGGELGHLQLEPRAEQVADSPPAEDCGGGVFLCTSGTTGAPKGVRLREAQLTHVARCVAEHHSLGPADRGFCPLPLFHINAEVVGLLATLAAEASLVIDKGFHRHGFWELMEDRRVTWINGAPAIVAILASSALPAGPPTGVRFLRSASAPLPVASLRRFETEVGITVLESYGMTEAASMITANPLEGPRKPGSVGLPVGTELRVVDRERPVPTGAVGGVQIRGPGVITSYAVGGKPEAFGPDHWLETGDLGYLDRDGYLYLVGRTDEVINRGGEKLYPREVEEVLAAHPAVAGAVVVGQPDRVVGARPVAYVVPAKDGTTDALAEELRALCAGALSAYKVPARVHLVHALPTGPTGKVSRRQVAAQLASAES